jgi:uncharacterized membrane protein YgdD (TMEM256/DUF423 family)
MNRTIFTTGIVFGLLAVFLGAFAAHGLEKIVDGNAIESFETGVRYQMYHALFLLLLSSISEISDKAKKMIFYIIVAGVFLFSFSIYFLATNSLTGFDFKTIAFVTPIGGLLLILGWIITGLKGWKSLK